MASELDNENNDLEHYGTWVKKDLQSHSDIDRSDMNIDDLEVSDLDFENENSNLSQNDDFLNDIDSLNIDEVSDLDSFDLGDIPEMDDDLISPEEEDELISMAEDNWSPENDQLDNEHWNDDSFPEVSLSEDDINAAGDFLPQEESLNKDSVTLSLAERQTQLLEKIENELSTIKDEILDIRSKLESQESINNKPSERGLEKDVTAESEVKGFFDEDDDESIVLTGDELDNIINTAEMTAEEGAGDSVVSDEDPGLSILSTPDLDDFKLDDDEELSLDDEDELSLDDEELSLDDEDELSLDDEDELSLDDEDELSLDDEDELSLDDEDELNLDDEDELNLDDEDVLSLDDEELSLDMGDFKLEEELTPDDEELSLDMTDFNLDDEELTLDDEALPINLGDFKLEEEPSFDENEIEEISLDNFNIPTEDIDNLVIDLTSEEKTLEDAIAIDDIPITEDVDLSDFGIEEENNEIESSDQEIAEVEDVSLDDLLGDTILTEPVDVSDEPRDDIFDLDLDLSDIEETDFDEGEIVHIDEELEEIHLDSDEDLPTEIEDISPLEDEDKTSAEPVFIDLPGIEDVDINAIHLDNSDLPEIEELDNYETVHDDMEDLDLDLDNDESLSHITESDHEITLDISAPLEMEDFDLDEEIKEELDEVTFEDHSDFELPGTEEIDLNSLEALAVSDLKNTEKNDEFEGIIETEEPIEIDLEDIADEVAEEFLDIIDDNKETPDEGDDVIAIDLPEDDHIGNIIDESEAIEELEEIDLIDDFELPEEEENLEILEEPEEFSFSQELSPEESEDEKNFTDEHDVAAPHKSTVEDHVKTPHIDKNDTASFLNKIPRETSLKKLPPELRAEIREILTYMDQLLESLPEDKIQEFARSEHFEVYKKIFEELGISN